MAPQFFYCCYGTIRFILVWYHNVCRECGTMNNNGDKNPRELRGLKIAKAKESQITRIDQATYKVLSQNGNGECAVSQVDHEWVCECSDNKRAPRAITLRCASFRELERERDASATRRLEVIERKS